ncbi:hypothetical protein QM716_22775 [Rhodococcus sp. IEGM 1409]|uniref:hypothetical protein n=1 Tax=Rhodococcus sp. IEGM 1409 TaxID=3047082 RepID=UPI0024B7D678|nr:hypothetical protein [Rhodococcus sp. IEGM 1409]MDI9902684.1 hypothetical protein [Rhodococcus sp. IEGM 1409]
MTLDLLSAIVTPPSGRSRAVLIDHHDYAHSVILQNREVPWDDPTSYANFFNQAQGLLRPDLALFDVARFYDHQLEVNPGLAEAMRAKTRTGYALRTMLGDKVITEKAIGVVSTLVSMSRDPLVLQLPSPVQWLSRTHHYGGGDVEALEADDGENASMYVADWLRRFAALPLAGVFLDDRTPAGSPDVVTVELDSYSPVVNIAAHYRLPLGLRRADGVHLHGDTRRGSSVEEGYWDRGTTVPAEGDFLIARIPAHAVPEMVLSRLDSLR